MPSQPLSHTEPLAQLWVWLSSFAWVSLTLLITEPGRLFLDLCNGLPWGALSVSLLKCKFLENRCSYLLIPTGTMPGAWYKQMPKKWINNIETWKKFQTVIQKQKSIIKICILLGCALEFQKVVHPTLTMERLSDSELHKRTPWSPRSDWFRL